MQLFWILLLKYIWDCLDSKNSLVNSIIFCIRPLKMSPKTKGKTKKQMCRCMQLLMPQRLPNSVLTKSHKPVYADLEPNNAVLGLFVDLQRMPVIHICKIGLTDIDIFRYMEYLHQSFLKPDFMVKNDNWMVLVERGDKNRGRNTLSPHLPECFCFVTIWAGNLAPGDIYRNKCDIAVDVFNLGLLAPPPLALGPWIAVCHV